MISQLTLDSFDVLITDSLLDTSGSGTGAGEGNHKFRQCYVRI